MGPSSLTLIQSNKLVAAEFGHGHRSGINMAKLVAHGNVYSKPEGGIMDR